MHQRQFEGPGQGSDACGDGTSQEASMTPSSPHFFPLAHPFSLGLLFILGLRTADRREIDSGLSMPVMLGVLLGSLLGARLLVGAQTRLLRIIFSAVVVALAIQMIYHGVTGRL